MPRIVGLVDVDHTLLFDDRLNQNLVNALKQKGIMDLYLFTDMTFRKSTIKDRQDLIVKLRNQGFTIHGVLSPNDLTWGDAIPAHEALALHTLCCEGPTPPYQGQFSGQAFEDFIQSQKSLLPQLAQTVIRYAPDDKCLGKGFSDAAEEFKTGELSKGLEARSIFAKAFGDHIAEKMLYLHTKGLLLDLFLHYKPGWVSSIVVADDNALVMAAVAQFKPTNKSMHCPLITMIPVRGEQITTADYEQLLQAHLDQDPYALIVQKIDRYIAKLQTTWNSSLKITALESLKNNILNKELDSNSLTEIVDEWADGLCFKPQRSTAIAVAISLHRKSFSPAKSPRETSTKRFISEVKEELGFFAAPFMGNRPS